MKLNKFLSLGLCCIAGALFQSCYDGLDIKPTSELENEYFETEVRVQNGVGAVYAALSNIYGASDVNNRGHSIFMLSGDDLTPKDGSSELAMEAFSGLNASNGAVARYWKNLYWLVYRANFMLEKIEEPVVKAVYVTPDLYEYNRGELLFLRAWAFSKLWDYFGKAPLQDKRIRSISDSYLPPSEGTQLLDSAICNLEEAAKLLPVPGYWDSKNKGRVFNESAYGLLTKLYVMRARYNKNADGDYGKAITAFEQIKTRRLITFGENFDYRHENNDESLFEFQASHAPEQDNPFLDNNFGGNVGTMGAYYHFFTAEWYSTTCGPTQKLIDAFEPGDPRIEETFTTEPLKEGWTYYKSYIPATNDSSYVQMVKYIRPDRSWFEASWGISSTNNYRIIRYADVKLMAAEAYLQNGNSGQALIEVNDVRKRARESTPDGVSSIPADLPSVDMQDIMDERLRELCGEDGNRWTDLRGWHRAGYVRLDNWSAKDFGFPYNAKDFKFDAKTHLLFPIPKSELDTNPKMAIAGNNNGY
ncbi:MAG: RagB/SusD family nutrient uptake outer membrane protein [Bacteroidales bacterium]|nr:RagB/SusD family nutrient uptake outer membrane protein [Bacteroidales bacterium]